MPPAPYTKIPWKDSFQGIFICRIIPGPRRVLPPRPPQKPRRVLPAAAGKTESGSVFPQDMCLGKNSSQTASVERTRCRCVRSARGGLLSLSQKRLRRFCEYIAQPPDRGGICLRANWALRAPPLPGGIHSPRRPPRASRRGRGFIGTEPSYIQHNPPAIQRDRGVTFRPGVLPLWLPPLSIVSTASWFTESEFLFAHCLLQHIGTRVPSLANFA